MAGTIAEKTTCGNCGSDVRENTSFCYNCGKRYDVEETQANGSTPDEISDEAKTALEDLAAKLKVEETESERLALAAAERKKARIAPKKGREVVWEAVEPSTGRMLTISLIILVLVAAAVFVTVYWK